MLRRRLYCAGAVAAGLLVSAALCWAQPFPSFILDSTVVRGPSMNSATGTSVAFGPDTGLVVWVEASSVRGARVDGVGQLIDTVPIDVSGPLFQAYEYMAPEVAYGGGRFLVGWSFHDGRTMCATIDADGHVTARSVLQDSVEGWFSSALRASVGYDGTNFLAAWTARTDDRHHHAYFARMSTQGVVLDSPPRLVVPDTARGQGAVSVEFHSDRYLAVWLGTGDNLHGSFILPDGSVPDTNGFLIRSGSGIRYPAVAHNGHHFVACWNESPDLTKVARITSEGVVLDTAGVCVDSLSLEESDVFALGETAMVAFTSGWPYGLDTPAVMVVRLDTALGRLDSMPLVLGARDKWGGPGYPSVGMCGDDYIVAWCQPYQFDSTLGNNVAVFRRVTLQGQPVESMPVTASYGINNQAYPDLATDGSNYLAVWQESRQTSAAYSRAMYGVRFTPDGTILDQVPITFGTAWPQRPVTAYGGGCYLVAWCDDGEVFCVRVTPDGQVLDSLPVHINGTRYVRPYLDVTYGDSVFLLVWPDYGTSPDQVQGVRVTPAGSILDSVPILLQAEAVGYCRYPQVGFDGTNFLVTRNNKSSHKLLGVRVSEAGQILDSADIAIGRSPSSSTAELAFGGGCYLATQSRTGASWRISPEGAVLEQLPIQYHGNAQVTFDGTDFMLLCAREDPHELGAIRVAPNGRILDSVPFLLVDNDSMPASVMHAAMAVNEAGYVGLVFRSTEPLPYNSGRIRAAVFPAIVGVHDNPSSPAVCFRAWPTVVRRVLFLPEATSLKPQAASLLDISGRKVLDLSPGANDVRALAPGVYFVRQASGVERDAASVTRVVIAR